MVRGNLTPSASISVSKGRQRTTPASMDLAGSCWRRSVRVEPPLDTYPWVWTDLLQSHRRFGPHLPVLSRLRLLGFAQISFAHRSARDTTCESVGDLASMLGI